MKSFELFLSIFVCFFGLNPGVFITGDQIKQDAEPSVAKQLLSVPLNNDRFDPSDLLDSEKISATRTHSIERKNGVSLNDTDETKIASATIENKANISTTLEKSSISSTVESTPVKTDISNDRASTTLSKTSQNTSSTELSGKNASKSTEDSSSRAATSDRSSPNNASTSNQSTADSQKSATDTSKTSASTESTSSKSSSTSSSTVKKPSVLYSVEDDPSLLTVNKVRQFITPLTPLDIKNEPSNAAYGPGSDEFDFDQQQSKNSGEVFIFPLVVLIFTVPLVLGVGILILRRVRDYWSTRHYRRMDFLVDGMYNT